MSKKKLLGAKLRHRDVYVSEIDGTVRVRAMSNRLRVDLLDILTVNEADIAAYDADMAKPEGERDGLEKVERLDTVIVTLIHSIVDEHTALPIYDMGDYEALRDLSSQSTTALWMATRELNDFRASDILLEKKDSA